MFGFSALHGMPARTSDEKGVCASVCPSAKRVDWKKNLFRFLYRTVSFSLVFREEEWLVGGDPFYLKFCVNRPPLERNRRFSTDILVAP